ncbi:MAG: leucine-rich repeat protein, partial [Paludibacter sp.]
WASTIYYPENELPQNAFSNTSVNTGIKYIYGKKTLKSIILPSNISSIGIDAFNECTALTTIKLPASLKTIKSNAFQNCTALTSIQNLSSTPPVYGVDALTGVKANACNMTVPTSAIPLYQADALWKNFKYIGGGYSLNITNSNESAGTVTGQEYRFYTLNESIKLKALPKNSKTSNSWVENGNIVSTDSIYSFKISGDRKLTVNFTRAESYSLTKAGTLSSYINSPQTLTHLTLSGSIDARDIRFIRDSLRAVQLLDFTHTSIMSYYGYGGSYVSTNLYNDNVFPTWAFFTYDINFGNRYLTTVKLPTNIVTIEYNAFNNCRKLDTITIPQGVTAINEFAFGYCNALKSIKNLSSKPVTLTSTVFTEVATSSCELLVPVGSESDYKSAPYWYSFNIKTGGYSVSVKCNNDFIGSVSGIESRFYALNETLKMKATAHNSSGFINWTENGKIISTDSILEIKVDNNRIIYANFGMEQTSRIEVAGTLNNLITNPKVLTSLTLTGKLDARDFEYIRDSIPSLETLDISKTQIVAYSVPNTGTSYKDNQLPTCAFSVGTYPCPGMKYLKNIILPQGLKSIGERAFYNNFALENVSMPVSLTNIYTNAFGYCTSLKTITLPPFLSSIDYTAFQNCSSLKTINNFSQNPIAITNNIFDGITIANCNLLVPTGYLNAYKSAAGWNNFNVSEGGYVITAVSNEFTTGTVSGTENRFYMLNEPVKVQCSALNGTTFKNWSDNGKVVSTLPNFSFNVLSNQHLIANFSKDETIMVDSAGTLKTIVKDWISTTKLTISGKIDARDIQFMRDSMPSLEDLDLRKS